MRDARRRPQRGVSPQRPDSLARTAMRRRKNRRVAHRQGPAWYVMAWRGLCNAVVACLVMAAAAGAVWGGVHGWRRLVADPRLAVRQVEVLGTQRTQVAEVVAYADAPLGSPMLGLDIDAVALRVRQHPWIRRASVRRRFPERVTIEVQEHIPTLLVSLGELYLADEDGQLFKSFTAGDGLVLPVVTGLDRDEAARRLDITTERVREAIGLAAAVDNYPAELGALDELHWDDDLGWSVMVQGTGLASVRIHLGRQPLGRLPMAMATLRVCADRHQSPAVVWADAVKNPDRVIVQLQSGLRPDERARGATGATGWRSAHGTEG